jgi:phage gp36-like protein
VTYTVLQDFIDAFGIRELIQLTNLDDASATEINLSRLEQNQQKAFARINGLIANCPDVRTLMPFTTPPPILKDFELDITRYYLDQVLPREDVRKRYEDAIAQLMLIGKCQMSLGLDSVPSEVLSGGESVRARVFMQRSSEFSENLLARF